MKEPPRTLEDRDRLRLRSLARHARGGILTLPRAAVALGVPKPNASAALASFTRRGWLKRLRRGIYLVLPLEAEAQTSGVVEDPWVLAAELFAPCYIGGWTAAERWGLTEQIFRPTFVATAAKVRHSRVSVGETEFFLARVPKRSLESVGSTWRATERVPLSSRERTIADALVDPRWVGGVRHLADIFRAYRDGKSWKPDELLAEVAKRSSGAAFKRLGYLAETLGIDSVQIAETALNRRSTGIVRLDPAIRTRGRLLKRWGLWINASVREEGRE
jgi:predicted transcriptional regulator of viral defense system